MLIGMDIGGTAYHVRGVVGKRTVDVAVPSEGNLHLLGADGMVRVLGRLVTQWRKKAACREAMSGFCAGISGLDGPTRTRALHKQLEEVAWWKRLDPNLRLVVNDSMIGLRAGTPSPSGMAIVSGTGSNGYAVDLNGQEAWVSGRGLWMSDEGSGAWIGVETLRAARRAEDGRGPSTSLLEAVLRHFDATQTGEIMAPLSQLTKMDLASLNRITERCALSGDKVAHEILMHAAVELLLMADTLHERLAFGHQIVDTVMVGGTLNKNSVVREAFLRGASSRRWMRPIPLQDDPVSGALFLLQDRLVDNLSSHRVRRG